MTQIVKYWFIFILVLAIFCVFIEGSVLAQVERNSRIVSLTDKSGEDLCNAVKNNLAVRSYYYALNTDLIISEYEALNSSFKDALEIYEELEFETVEFASHIQRVDRYIDDIDSLKMDVVMSLSEASEEVCVDERAMKRFVNDASESLRDLKQELNDLNSFLLLKVSPTIQLFK